MKFYHRLPWLVMALFMYGLYTWLCSLSKHNSITVFNCSISAVLSALCFPAQLLNGRGRYYALQFVSVQKKVQTSTMTSF